MKKMVFSASFAALALVGVQQSARAEVPPVVTISGAGYAGSGCPVGSADIAISTDGQILYAAFDRYVAKTIPGGSSIARLNCQLRVGLHFSPGWSVAISSVDYRGFAGLKPGVIGEQKTTYFFAGGPIWGDTSMTTRIPGPFFNNYARSDSIGVIRYSPCGARDPMLIINTEVRVNGVEGEMTLDSIIKKVQHAYHLTWMKCP
ncbi:MAG: DUF4360 domain-containing protein [Minicystis sp.]